ncbi:hypothetical protein JCM33374_g3546 [Metschnikowia sp. JCM 33374]|nr:hypothetical protein JCM33374_g3546 [Metschnikowia sp. JCM 33374]
MDSHKPNASAHESASRRRHSKLVQVVQNFFTKTSQVIVQARSVAEAKVSPYETAATGSGLASANGNGSGSSKINKWFNLHMPSLDNEWVRQELRPWKSHVDLSQFPPMIIETYLDLRQLSPCQMVMLEDDHGGMWPVAEGGSKKSEVVLERWLIEFDRTTINPSPMTEELPLVYKQAIVLIRVIYGIVRLLPAYKAKKLVAKSSNKNLALRNRFVDGKQPVNSKGRIGLSKSIVPHQMLLTDSHMTQREFSPIHTSLGTLRVSVAYRNHHKFNVQDQEERLSNHFMFSDNERARDSQDLHERGDLPVASLPQAPDFKQDPAIEETTSSISPAHIPQDQESKARRGSFGQFREKYSVSPCTSEIQDKSNSPSRPSVRKHNSVTIVPPSSTARPSIQPFKVGSIGASSSPPHSSLASVQASGQGSSMERRISITSNRSGSNASLVALLRNPRGSTSSSNTTNTVAASNVHGNNPSLPRAISCSHGSHIPTEDNYLESTSNTPRFSSSFGSRQSRRFSNTSARYAMGSTTESNAYYGTSVESNSSSVPFSGLYADDDISSFVQMIDGTSELRLSNSNHESKSETPNNDSSTHFEALNRFQLLKSHYQHLSDSVNASLVLQHNRSRSASDEKLITRRSSRSTGSPAPSLPIGSYENSHMPSINSRLSKFGDDASLKSSESKPEFRPSYTPSAAPNLLSLPSTVTTIAHATHGISPGSKKVVTGLATSPSVYESAKQVIKYEDVFEEDDEGIDYFATSRGNKHLPSEGHDLSFDNDDLLFEMTDTNTSIGNKCSGNIITPVEAYDQRVALNKLRDDPYQRKILSNLSSLHAKLVAYEPPVVGTPEVDSLKPKVGFSKLISGLFSRGESTAKYQADSPVKGIYLWGDVGCGKTMLMDLFYSTVPPSLPKRRFHFHQFMQNLHKRSYQLKREHGHIDLDVIPLLASEIAQTSTVLCFDEFQVTDVADAMLLRRLLTMLLSPEYGVVLFATSNRAPDDLYLNGIQRVSFIPCIRMIKKETKVIYLNSPTDYRKIARPFSSVYYYPKPGVKYHSKVNINASRKHVEKWFEYFNQASTDKTISVDDSITVWGRDYLTLANTFKAFVIIDIPYLSIDVRDKVRRFITFLDAVYDAHGCIATTGAAAFKDLFVEPENLSKDNYQLYKRQSDTGTEETFENDELVVKHGFDKSVAKKAAMFANDEEKFAFARALSRLTQMGTTDWLEESHVA